MEQEVRRFIEEHVGVVQPLAHRLELAQWEVATTGSSEANRESARLRAELRRIYADQAAYERVRAWREAGPLGDPLLDRQLTLLYLAYQAGQQDAETIERVTALEAEVEEIYTNFRAVYRGERVSDNDLERVLATETDSAAVREAWEASKEVGRQVADRVLEIVALRNAAARRMGYPSYYQRSLSAQEIDEARLFEILDELERLTRDPFRRAKADLDAELAQRFGVEVEQLRPWHYGDRFFQNPPPLRAVDVDALFQGKDLEALAVRTFDGMGMDVRDILARSDLYARPGKNQHAFCTHIDRSGDVRILCNLQPTARWMDTLLHELGHGVYDKYLDMSLPYLLREPAHILSTEAIAILMGRLATSPAWLVQVAGVPAAEVARIAPALERREQLAELIFVRWMLVMTHFERAMYADPRQDLNALWWDLVERFQLLRRPEGRHAPDWAAKIHLALFPVYYHNYQLGALASWQLQTVIEERFGGLVDRPEAGSYLREAYFRLGARHDWDETLRLATGARLSPAYFARRLANGLAA
ncbi:MAG TPA: M2 family metallopeptidase [Chloroflexota bacterium]